MLKYSRITLNKEVKETTKYIDKHQHGVYAYPHESEEERQITRHLMKDFIKDHNQG